MTWLPSNLTEKQKALLRRSGEAANGSEGIARALTARRKAKGLKTALRESEAQFQARIVQYAQLKGFLVYHTHNSKHSPEGFPDLVMVRPSKPDRPARLVIAELKSEKGRLRPMQKLWLEYLRECEGVETFLWRPSQWESIMEVLS